LLDGYCWGDAVDIVHSRFVHAIQKLPHVRAERLDVASLAFGINCLERQTRFAAAARPGNDGQLPYRKIYVDPLEIVLARTANLDTNIPRLPDYSFPLLAPDLRTHWKQSMRVKPFANFLGSARLQRAGEGILPSRTSKLRGGAR
jgi:hypothetical protein